MTTFAYTSARAVERGSSPTVREGARSALEDDQTPKPYALSSRVLRLPYSISGSPGSFPETERRALLSGSRRNLAATQAGTSRHGQRAARSSPRLRAHASEHNP